MKTLRNILGYWIFVLNNKKPWSLGYGAYKWSEIRKAINSVDFTTCQLKKGYGFRIDERIIEYPWLFSRLPEVPGKLLDAGSILNHELILSHSLLQNKKIFISTLAPEKTSFWKNHISYIYEDLREVCYRDNYFDFIVSLSTIEHIGLDNTLLYTKDTSKKEKNIESYILAIQELHRVLKPGGKLYLSFPFGRYKNYGWFQIFDSQMLETVIESFAPTTFQEFHFRYEWDGWKVSSREESKDATYFDINTQKVYDKDYAAASRAIVCLEMVK